ncbi:uncharacterized protein LOC127632566 isoform X2 [Xyrauchen texanus]|uniref:uncharacterized protein LOC127632566 isoform X2 n=1 Tax=Xyrauchen texanus TaxID=154827 RepID=UPI002241CA53|nr:uncharacterized protein LOC127632566 isoform X2 [Xyrauchen texanus]
MELPWCRVHLLLLASSCLCSLDRVSHNSQNNIFCPKGFLNCTMNYANSLRAHDVDYGPVRVCSLAVRPKLCCYRNNCKPCLWINIQLSIIPDLECEEYREIEGSGDNDENSGNWDSECVSTPNYTSVYQEKKYPPCEDQLGHQNSPAAITICYTSAERLPSWCKRLDFIVTSATGYKPLNLILIEYRDAEFGRKMKISVGSFSQSAEVEIPTLRTVCSSPQNKEMKACKGPRVGTKIDTQNGVVRLQLANEEGGNSEPLHLCMKRGREGKCSSNFLMNNTIPLKSVTNCTCFQAWKDGSTRSEFCPFKEHAEFRKNALDNVSVSVAHTKTYDGLPVLSWILTAPCRLKAELWPCQVQADGECKEVDGFRLQCCNKKDWEENVTALWASGTFVNISSRNPHQLCLMLQVDGKILHYNCQHPLERQYWSLLIILPLIIVCLAIFGSLLLMNKLKWSLSKWDRSHHSKDTRGQVLLLHYSAAEPWQTRLVCKLGQLLSELGFHVSLDLWNQAELSTLGPMPWLHSKLGNIQKQGGKALLLLSPSTLQRAKCYWNFSREGMEESHSNRTINFSDILGAALDCIFADFQKGGAGERFVLVQLDSHEHLINEGYNMPMLLRGLPLYKLPSQSQALLKELCLESPNSVSGKLKKMWWIKWARRKLAQGIKNDCNGKRKRTESMLTQMDSISLDTEDMEEKVFLKTEQL